MSEKTSPHESSRDIFAAEDTGLQKGMGARQLQMIAIGSAIGTGLLLGTGSRLSQAGPFLAILYLICGFFGYIILRSLGELIIYRPSSGSFVSYAREFYGEKSAFITGWLYWGNWAMTLVADSTAVAIYIKWFSQYTSWLDAVPQWALALFVICAILFFNMLSVKIFGELEFWFSLIKVVALLIFMLVAIGVIIFGHPSGSAVGFSLIGEAGGWTPNGLLAAIVVIQGVVFAYAGIELVGTTSGETKNVEKLIPKAINSVLFRILIFYFGSVLLLTLVLPYTTYVADVSPFVTFFDSLGLSAAAPIFQLVVITAAISSLNAGLYSTGRIMYNMSTAGSGPKFGARMSKTGVPYGGIVMAAGVGLTGVFLNYVVPEMAFEIVLNLAALGTMASWAAIVIAHQKFVRLSQEGKYTRPQYRSPFGVVGDWLTIAFLLLVIVLMAFDYPIGTYTLLSSVLLIPIFMIMWYSWRGRIKEIARQRKEQHLSTSTFQASPQSDLHRK
ncbi:amino acid permease [Corynebacterium sp. sy017]|uniref:amino acid permease n=1 Tax=unclassified Corynebacterium TaxID=2624378 RepID=UPI001186E234|nr:MULTISPECIES: amino acid permease [unclassified Corynebacterium]MBP3088935.1 amino acid permease [Corynebacterium sp. sy017]TSD91263.1 amino acid permease [Corynebacterium sp. SY003]